MASQLLPWYAYWRRPPNKGAPMVWRTSFWQESTKVGLISLIIDRFSIPNHHLKAQNTSFYCMLPCYHAMRLYIIRHIRYIQRSFSLEKGPAFFPRRCPGLPWISLEWPELKKHATAILKCTLRMGSRLPMYQNGSILLLWSCLVGL